MIKILIIGYGLIGKERENAIKQLINEGYSIEYNIYDPFIKNLFKNNLHINNFDQIDCKFLDLVIISTPHDEAEEFAKYFIKKNIDILIEKPLGRSLNIAKKIKQLKNNSKIHVGFNYEYFEPLLLLLEDIENNLFGQISRIAIEMGHGNSPGIEKTWKLDKKRAGGGCVIDPGIHLINLMLQITKIKPKLLFKKFWKGFWSTGIEEEALLVFESKKVTYEIKLSLIKWKSTFNVYVQGTEGYANVSGRGRSYGVQEYRRGKRWSWQNGKSQSENEEIVCKSDCSTSFYLELKDILDGKPDNFSRAFKCMEIVDEVYK